ncbi:hypothetical protein [Streptomyces sp. NPDC058268]|uniref:hypothetical protein n=1 Tax=Streptomyces sp. NPDC058268 TaxID=3346413 RepID=UPI0036E1CFCF
MDRRSFLVLSGGALVDLAVDWARIEPRHLHQALDGQPVDTELMEWLEERSRELRALSSGQHPKVSRLVDAALGATIDLIAQDPHSPDTGRRLHAAPRRKTRTRLPARHPEDVRHASPGPARACEADRDERRSEPFPPPAEPCGRAPTPPRRKSCAGKRSPRR